ncbi:hypothetical protein FFWV33_05200 [Flavobacterium faecale]|uniref:C4-dicarboxylate ABC transporter n=1 Tax=Flavobacterium faecale TaxID=1355330 RepID=A0A2S1LBQ6_9FLAO|nr:hypothetical protein FFWV33_05200 [Flavobacterium faecale]
MKKIAFYLSLFISLYLVFTISNIFLYHIDKLNQYGYGFLAGQSILLLFFTYLTYRFKKNNSEKLQF